MYCPTTQVSYLLPLIYVSIDHLLVYYQVLPLYFVIFPKEEPNLLEEWDMISNGKIGVTF